MAALPPPPVRPIRPCKLLELIILLYQLEWSLKFANQRSVLIDQFPGIECIPGMELNASSPRCIQDVVWSRNGTLEDDGVRINIWQSENLALKVTFCVPIAPKFEVWWTSSSYARTGIRNVYKFTFVRYFNESGLKVHIAFGQFG